MTLHIFKFLLLIPLISFSQSSLKGMIMDGNDPDKKGIYNANITWLNTTIGTSTNKEGWFEIPYDTTYKKLVISFLGYKTDTINISSTATIHHVLTLSNDLEEVVITVKRGLFKNRF